MDNLIENQIVYDDYHKANITPGDILIREYMGNFHHTGIYMGDNFVRHYTCDYDGLVSTVTMDMFMNGYKKLIICKTNLNPNDICKRSTCNETKVLFDGSYNLFTNNCQNFVFYCCTSKSRLVGDSYDNCIIL